MSTAHSVPSEQAHDTAAKLPIEELRAAGLLGNLGDSDALRLVTALRPILRSFRHDAEICHSGDIADRFWIVISGNVRIVEQGRERAEHLIFRHAGDVLGEIAYLRPGLQRTATMIASGPVDVWEIKFDCIDALEDLRLQNVLIRALGRAAADKFADANRHRADLSSANDAMAALLDRFVNEYALGSTKTVQAGLRVEYLAEDAVFLFSDIVGFSGIAEKLGAERTAALLKQVLDAQGRAIKPTSGQIDKFVGDAVMAFWIISADAAEPRRKACQQAVRAALDSVKAVEAVVNPLDGSPMQVRIGLHVGKAFSGDFGATDRAAFTFIGQDVNIAARLEQAHDENVDDGHKPLGAVRVSAELFDHLPPELQEHLPNRSVVTVKKTNVTIFSTN